MITADEAHERSSQIRIEMEQPKIEEAINAAIKKGEFSCSLDYSISASVQEQLESLGFKVYRIDDYRE